MARVRTGKRTKRIVALMPKKKAKAKKYARVSAAAVAAAAELAEKVKFVRSEVDAEGTWLWAAPAIEAHGFGELRVVGIGNNPGIGACPKGEPVFEVHGHFTVAALKQLMAGTVFTLKRRDWSLQELREKAEMETVAGGFGGEGFEGRVAMCIVEMLTARGVPVLQARLLAEMA